MSSIKSIKWFKVQSGKGVTFDIIFSGIMLGLVILFTYLEHFMPWLGAALKINLSLIFLLMTWIICGAPWAGILLLIRTIVSPAFSGFAYTEIGLYSVSLLLFSDLIYLGCLLGAYYSFKIIIKNDILFLISVLSTATIISTLFLTLMNGLWMSPLFWKLFDKHLPLYPGIVDEYNSNTYLHVFLFGIPNYWAAIWTVMGTGNLLKFGLTSLLVFPMIKVSTFLTHQNSKNLHF